MAIKAKSTYLIHNEIIEQAIRDIEFDINNRYAKNSTTYKPQPNKISAHMLEEIKSILTNAGYSVTIMSNDSLLIEWECCTSNLDYNTRIVDVYRDGGTIRILYNGSYYYIDDRTGSPSKYKICTNYRGNVVVDRATRQDVINYIKQLLLRDDNQSVNDYRQKLEHFIASDTHQAG